MSNVSGWLPYLLGPVQIQQDGVAATPRGAINFKGFTVTDNPDDDSVDIEANLNGIAVTGTPAVGAVLRATSASAASWGQLDLADADAVTGILAEAHGGTGGTSLLAAIAAARLAALDALLDANHIHVWKLNETSGNFVDTGSSASKVTLTATNSPVYGCKGPFGPSILFGVNGTTGAAGTGYASANITSFSDLPTDALTMEAWICWWGPSVIPSTSSTIFAVVPGAGTLSPALSIGNSKLLVGHIAAAGDATTSSGRDIPSPNIWTHLAFTFVRGNSNNGVAKLYANGELIGSCTNLDEGLVYPGSGTLRVASGGTQFPGFIARACMSNVTRTQAEIRAVVNAGLGY